MNFSSIQRLHSSALAILIVTVSLALSAPLTAGSVPSGGANWQIVNDAFTRAIQQQTVNQNVLFHTPPQHSPLSNAIETKAALDQAAPPGQNNIKKPANSAVTQPETSAKWGWISEIRLGVLKHSAPISTQTPKEKGIDANIEVLFKSPRWLEILWSPRPHIGASFNASNDDTDMAYAGLTWEWLPIEDFFINASFGFAVHNGRLHVDATDTDWGRRREFGCEALLRETLEFGYRFTGHQSLSVIWDHVSHGGLCDDENEGMDNAGVRYGYKF